MFSLKLALKNKCMPLMRGVVVGAALLGSGQLPAVAAPQWCNGTLSNLQINAAGDVFVQPSWLGNMVIVCNVNQNAGAITPAICMNWVTLMRSAVQRGAQTWMQYADAPACNAMPTYSSAPYPWYIMMVN